jgi:hypothetical protein
MLQRNPPSESQTQKPTSPDHRPPLTAFEAHNGRSTFGAGTALHAPQPTFEVPQTSDRLAREPDVQACRRVTFLPARDPRFLPNRQRHILLEGEDASPVVLHIDDCPALCISLIECLVELPDGRGAIIGKFSNCVVVVDE